MERGSKKGAKQDSKLAAEESPGDPGSGAEGLGLIELEAELILMGRSVPEPWAR